MECNPAALRSARTSRLLPGDRSIGSDADRLAIGDRRHELRRDDDRAATRVELLSYRRADGEDEIRLAEDDRRGGGLGPHRLRKDRRRRRRATARRHDYD